MQVVKNELLTHHSLLNKNECDGLVNCIKYKTYKGCKVMELQRNAILYKGITNLGVQNNKYLQDDKYIPLSNETQNYIFLAGTLPVAAHYTHDDDGRIITFKTILRLNLLDLSDKDTLIYIFTYCEQKEIELEVKNNVIEKNQIISFKKAFSTAYGISRYNQKLYFSGRESTRSNDYNMISLLQKIFIWVDGYASNDIKNNDGSIFHEELAIINPSNCLVRNNIEYRPTNIMYCILAGPIKYNYNELWYKIKNGKYIQSLLIPKIGIYHHMVEKRSKYKQRPHDYRDDFINDLRIYDIDQLSFNTTIQPEDEEVDQPKTVILPFHRTNNKLIYTKSHK